MRIGDAVYTERISHVGDVVLSESSLLGLGHGTLVLCVVFGGGCETGFCQAAFEDFHDAVCVRVAGLTSVLDLATLSCASESVRCVHGGCLKMVDYRKVVLPACLLLTHRSK